MKPATVTVIGAGVAGALVAYRLAQEGCSVLMLEAGPRRDRGEAVERFRRDPYGRLSSPYALHPLAPRPCLEDLNEHYLQSGPDLFMGLYERGVGGTTWHWLGTAMRMLPDDLEMDSRYGVGQDWPLTWSELAPFYEQAERELGVAGPAEGLQPAHPLSGVDQAVVEACQQLGLPYEALPQARNSRPWQGRPACCRSASCVPICPVGAKYDASIHVSLAEELGVTVWPESPVVALEWDSLSGRVARLKVAGRGEGRWFPVETVVLAGNAVESVRLLQSSGLAQSSSVLGRGLMGASAVLSWGLAPSPVHPRMGPQASLMIPSQRSGPHRAERATFVTTVASDGWPHGHPYQMAQRLAQSGLRGVALRTALTDHLARQVALVSTCEELPEAHNRIRCDERFPDALGVGRPRVDYRIGDYTRRAFPVARQLHQEILEAMGAQQIGHQEAAADSAYLLGTARMGHDPRRSVVDRHLRSHQHPNLYLVGGGVFPTSGSAPPTLTVAALALRLAQHLTGRA